MQVAQLMKIIPIVLPLDVTAGISSDVVNMAKWNHLAIYVQQGAWTAGTAQLTVEACDDNVPNTSPNMDFNYRVATMGAAALSDIWGVYTWSTHTGITLPNTPNRATIIELNAADVWANRVARVAANDGYHRVRITIGGPGNACMISVTAILTQYRYAEDLLATALD